MAISEQDRDAIRDAISTWSAGDQIALATEILQRVLRQLVTIEIPEGVDAAQRSTWEALYGIAANGQEPPSDQQVEQWLDERRTKEYDD